jgi:hypothetical protein
MWPIQFSPLAHSHHFSSAHQGPSVAWVYKKLGTLIPQFLIPKPLPLPQPPEWTSRPMGATLAVERAAMRPRRSTPQAPSPSLGVQHPGANGGTRNQLPVTSICRKGCCRVASPFSHPASGQWRRILPFCIYFVILTQAFMYLWDFVIDLFASLAAKMRLWWIFLLLDCSEYFSPTYIAGTGIPSGMHSPLGFGTGRERFPWPFTGTGTGTGKIFSRRDGDGKMIPDGEFPVVILARISCLACLGAIQT